MFDTHILLLIVRFAQFKEGTDAKERDAVRWWVSAPAVPLTRRQTMACKPLSAMMLSNFSAGPAGRVSPCSHLRTVEAVVCR